MERIQRKRVKGWRNPPNTKYVGNPTKWGNPHDWELIGREEAVRLYRLHITEKVNAGELDLNELKSYDHLSCFCSLDEPCHADVLVELINKQ